MKLEKIIQKKYLLLLPFLVVSVTVIVGLIPDKPQIKRMVQLCDLDGSPIKGDKVYVMDCNGKKWIPDDAGIVRVPPGPMTVFDALTDKIIIVVDIPADGPSPYPVPIRQ